MAVGKSSKFTGLMAGLSGLEEKAATRVTAPKETLTKDVENETVKEAAVHEVYKEERYHPGENLDVSIKLHLSGKKKERLTARKTFIIPETYSRKMEEMAEAAGMSQNQLFIKILEQIFGE